ncbi:formin-like protein 3 [Lotus japonicus]|uniref:formin-like protein 3 n=1 Tax=Lotus japonicus TaxID=34305 RepID=UPI002589A2B2|nr:formin-like protein 3 [Lotus japonicus]
MKKKAGRPKKNRRRDGTEEQVAGRARRDATESQLAGRVRRSYPVMTCSRCGFEGHNTRSCHQQGCRIRPKNWVPPPPEDETENAEQVEINVSQTAPTEDIPQSQPTQGPTGSQTPLAPAAAASYPTITTPQGPPPLQPRVAYRAPIAAAAPRQPPPLQPRVAYRAPIAAVAAPRQPPPLQPRAAAAPRQPPPLAPAAAASSSTQAPPLQPRVVYSLTPSVATAIMNQRGAPHATAAYRAPPVRGKVFRPPRQRVEPATTTHPPQSQGRRSPPPGPATHELPGGPMVFMPTPSIQPRPPQNP